MGRNYKEAIRLGVANIDHPQISAGRSLTDRHSGAFAPRPILTRICQNVFNLTLFHTMTMDVG
jgi:hypothetical protein